MLALLSIYVMPCVAANNSPKDDETAIRQTIAQYEKGWNTHDGYVLGSCFTDDADFINILGDRMSGRSQIEKSLTVDHYDDPRAPFRHSSMHIKIEKVTFVAPTAADLCS